MGEKDGWNEWSKHVLIELERLNQNYGSLNDKIDSIKTDVHEEISILKNEITKVKSMQYTLDDLKVWKKTYEDSAVLTRVKEINNWKKEVEEIYNIDTFKKMKSQIAEQDKFKTQATTAFWIAQSLIATALALLKILG